MISSTRHSTCYLLAVQTYIYIYNIDTFFLLFLSYRLRLKPPYEKLPLGGLAGEEMRSLPDSSKKKSRVSKTKTVVLVNWGYTEESYGGPANTEKKLREPFKDRAVSVENYSN